MRLIKNPRHGHRQCFLFLTADPPARTLRRDKLRGFLGWDEQKEAKETKAGE